MANNSAKDNPQSAADAAGDGYVVVARRFRPQSFADLIGQDQVAKALSNAIDRTRVGHAYLFTGARGVGKTSTARIFAKCLNCFEGPTDQPCGQCDVCIGVSEGDDVDVLEIDGASNRGIEEIRTLRANVNVKPSRARYKIYIIDEVHMLTTPAFNALLKTLEEPPAHVKFFFCTTDPEKIPITVLSRCQRFDLPPISMEQIKSRLAYIAEQDSVAVDDQALDILARRANGSMRDSQSLLDQLFSFCGNQITAADVHALLGTADSSQVLAMLQAAVARDSSLALKLVAEAIDGGVDAGQLVEQLLNLYRDMMTLHVGCTAEQLLFCNAADVDALQSIAGDQDLESILAAIEILDAALTRMRQSTHTRTLLETAVVRICHLPDLQAVSNLIEGLKSGNFGSAQGSPQSQSTARKKKTEITRESNGQLSVAKEASTEAEAAREGAEPREASPPGSPAETRERTTGKEPADASNSAMAKPAEAKQGSSTTVQLSSDNCEKVWKSVLGNIDDMTSDLASMYEAFAIEQGRLVVTMKDAYHRDACLRSERKQRLEQVLSELVGGNIRIDFVASSKAPAKSAPNKPKQSRIQKIRQIERRPLVKQAIELFDAEITDVIDPPKRNGDG